MKRLRAVAPLLLLPVHSLAETSFTTLTDKERRLLRAEIRATLLAHPELLRGPSPGTAPDYDAEVASDHALIKKHETALFSPDLPGAGSNTAAQRVTLFTRPGCAACDTAKAELLGFADTHDLRVYLIDTTENPTLAKSLGVDEVPFYVMPRMMLRGPMPAAVLERYFVNKTGQ